MQANLLVCVVLRHGQHASLAGKPSEPFQWHATHLNTIYKHVIDMRLVLLPAGPVFIELLFSSCNGSGFVKQVKGFTKIDVSTVTGAAAARLSTIAALYSIVSDSTNLQEVQQHLAKLCCIFHYWW